MSIETKNYIATASDIEKLAESIIQGARFYEGGQSTYLKALIATTQAELGSEPRRRTAKGLRLKAEVIVEHLAAFDIVATRFYEAVKKVASNGDANAHTVRQSTAFARSAASTARGYIRAGNDVRLVAAAKASKGRLASPRSERKLTVEVLKRQVETLGEQLARVARKLAATNSQLAADLLIPILEALSVHAGQKRNTKSERKGTPIPAFMFNNAQRGRHTDGAAAH